MPRRNRPSLAATPSPTASSSLTLTDVQYTSLFQRMPSLAASYLRRAFAAKDQSMGPIIFSLEESFRISSAHKRFEFMAHKLPDAIMEILCDDYFYRYGRPQTKSEFVVSVSWIWIHHLKVTVLLSFYLLEFCPTIIAHSAASRFLVIRSFILSGG